MIYYPEEKLQLVKAREKDLDDWYLITLNQSEAERKEDTMRLHIAKSRFFSKGDTFKIATDYANEVFYDARRTMSLKARSAS